MFAIFTPLVREPASAPARRAKERQLRSFDVVLLTILACLVVTFFGYKPYTLYINPYDKVSLKLPIPSNLVEEATLRGITQMEVRPLSVLDLAPEPVALIKGEQVEVSGFSSSRVPLLYSVKFRTDGTYEVHAPEADPHLQVRISMDLMHLLDELNARAAPQSPQMHPVQLKGAA